jgi:hypothetical protein
MHVHCEEDVNGTAGDFPLPNSEIDTARQVELCFIRHDDNIVEQNCDETLRYLAKLAKLTNVIVPLRVANTTYLACRILYYYTDMNCK